MSVAGAAVAEEEAPGILRHVANLAASASEPNICGACAATIRQAAEIFLASFARIGPRGDILVAADSVHTCFFTRPRRTYVADEPFARKIRDISEISVDDAGRREFFCEKCRVTGVPGTRYEIFIAINRGRQIEKIAIWWG